MEMPIIEFPTQTKRGKLIRRERCRPCIRFQQKETYFRNHESRKARNKQSHALHRDERLIKQREYSRSPEQVERRKQHYHANRDRILEDDWKRGIQRRYGVSFEEYQQILTDQDGKCAICKSSQPWARGKRFAIDHDHATGRVRGLLCHLCNKGIGLFKDNPELLRDAALYVERHKD